MTAFHHGRKDEFSKWQKIPGFQLRYIYFYNKKDLERLAVPVIPFEEIDKRGAKMYKGKRPESISSDAAFVQKVDGGAIPTSGLQ